MLLIVLESPQWVGLNEDNLEILRPKVREILSFWVFIVIGNLIKLPKKKKFGEENLVQ
jgi:hypothetical protein